MSKEKIKIKINNQEIIAEKGQTILEIAMQNGIKIPYLCYHPDLKPKASCRLCLVKIKGYNELKTSCSTIAEDGMEIITESPEIKKARKTNLELLFGEHSKECSDCVYEHNCQLLQLAKKLNIQQNKYLKRKSYLPSKNFGPAIHFQKSKCIDCQNCVEACKKYATGYLEVKEKGPFFRIEPSKDKGKICLYCGQCLAHCPVGAFEAAGEFEEVNQNLANKNKIVVFQFAPSIRTSIGEEFGLFTGEDLSERIVAGLKKIGADYVFDTCVGADFTTSVEAKHCIEKLEAEKNPLVLTSCCPSWVRYVEFYYPEFIKNLATVRSPQIILGGLVKTYWAAKMKIDPKNIYIISIMPCTAKKYEITREELSINSIKPVDQVITTREIAYLFHKKNIHLLEIDPEKPDNPLGISSGAGVIYGASGGVMTSALRTVADRLKQKIKINFVASKEIPGVKEAKIKINNKKYRVAIVVGIAGAKKIMQKQKKNPGYYNFIEVMVCPGGCIGGGGQPVPNTKEMRDIRARGLFKIDQDKNLRLAHKNPIVKTVFKEYFNNEKNLEKVCKTKFSQKFE
jgi:iron-only hydrogenase group A